MKAQNDIAEESGSDRLHTWWELSYASYLTLPRSLMQSMPDEWQGKMCDLLEELTEAAHAHKIEFPPEGCFIDVRLRRYDTKRYERDELARYERGRRKLWDATGK